MDREREPHSEYYQISLRVGSFRKRKTHKQIKTKPEHTSIVHLP